MAVTASNATILNSDGDFGMQTPDSQITTPWSPVGGDAIATTDSQSPFTNVYANNGIGGNLIGGNGSYIVDFFEPQTTATAPMLYCNFDVCLNEQESNVNEYQHFALSLDAGTKIMFDAYVGSNAIFVSNGYGAYDLVSTQLSPNTWYNLQFAFDLNALTYSGRIATETEAFEVATRTINSSATATYYNAWTGTVNSFFTDKGTYTSSTPDSYDVDNVAISNTAFDTVGPAATPEGSTAETVVNIDFNGYRDGDDPTYAVTYAPANGEIWNGISVNSLGGNDNVSISASNLLDDEGNTTSVSFSVNPVGGDLYLTPGLTNLRNDYLFTNSADNTSDAAFTISGLENATTADLLFSGSGFEHLVFDGAESLEAVFFKDWGYFYDVPVVNGTITGTFGDGTGSTVVVAGMSVFFSESENPQIPGDANNDQKVDGSDVTILAGNWQKGVSDGQTANWEDGDFNGDGKVDGSDVTILAGNWQYGVTAAATSVPEPSMILLILGGLLSTLLIRRKC